MSKPTYLMLDGNEAVARAAYKLSEVIAIYPITPSSPMGEWSDEWAALKQSNLWGTIPDVVEMQSEGGAAGAVHGALQGGALATTFTSSQGLLLMIPNMYKIAGELTPYCMHVAARTVATHALSIFGDHSDVMACRQCGFAMLSSNSPQEAHDLAAIGHLATLASRVPFLHFFDGFRSSHEVNRVYCLTDDDFNALIDPTLIDAHRKRALSPDAPVLRGTAQNPDVFFQARESANSFYDKCPAIVADVMRKFGERTGRHYRLFEYVGHPEAERVIILMGSGAETAHETVEWMTEKGEKVGILKIRLYRPFSVTDFLKSLPKSVKKIAVLDRTKEPGAIGDPLYMDVVTTFAEAQSSGTLPFANLPVVVGGRYGLSSKEFTPACVKGVFDELSKTKPKNHFVVGIVDDVTHTSLPVEPEFDIEPDNVTRAMFYGLGADGTVGANKNSIKIIGEEAGFNAQGYFVYDSKKSGAITISHLRFGPKPIRSTYLIRSANFIGCHQFTFLDQYDVLASAKQGAVFLLNAPYAKEEVWERMPANVRKTIRDKKLRFYTIDAYQVAKDLGLGTRINTIMQTCFFAISGVLPSDQAVDQIKKAIEKTYSKRGPEVVQKNFEAVDQTVSNLTQVDYSKLSAPSAEQSQSRAPAAAPEFYKRVEAVILANQGDLLPVSAFPIDGTWPTATSQWEKRNIASEIPVWDAAICIQCNKCSFVCPHAAIRPKVYAPDHLKNAPATFKSTDFRGKEYAGMKYTLQVAAEDCTGCTLCVEICPVKDKKNPRHKAIDMALQIPLREPERENYRFFLDLPEADRTTVRLDVKGSQFLQPLFEYSGACAGCGETPYVKLLTQLFGDRIVIANATGCSSIYGANLPTTPYTKNREGRGPAWCNSLFEDNGEFGFGIQLALDFRKKRASELVKKFSAQVGDALVTELLTSSQADEAGIAAQRKRVEILKGKIRSAKGPDAEALKILADNLVEKTVWVIGGDGWAYDIGFGGLDHILSTRRNVKVLVLDTEVYSNTGGQQSKSTPMGAAAKFAVAGKDMPKKDLGMMAMTYGHVYVAQVAFGAKDVQTMNAFKEAASYDGPALIIAYSHCIAHGFDLAFGADQQKKLVDSGIWPLYRFDPRRAKDGLPALQIDSGKPSIRPSEYLQGETRFRMAEKIDPKRFEGLMQNAQDAADRRFAMYQELAGVHMGRGTKGEPK
ncbi:MAG: pyruvate:ferredoxin (flavodoxin) oxidoreductase [Pseudomonadota bacterium]